MKDETLDLRVNLANRLADLSGNIIKQYFRQSNLESETKITEVSSMVTIADRLAENAMVDLIKKECPEDLFFCQRFTYFWYIDRFSRPQ